VVPTRARARAVRLAHAGTQLARGLQVWASPDALPLSGWVRREAQRSQTMPDAATPRLLGAAEAWYLWRSCTREAVHELALLDAERLAEGLQRADALARDYALRPQAEPGGSEGALLLQTQRQFEARCRALHAVTAERWFAQLPAIAPGRVWLAGFNALPPPLQPLQIAQAAASCAPLRVHAASAAEEGAQIAAWCQSRLRADPRTRLLVIAPGPAGPRARLADEIRGALDARAVLAHESAAQSWVGSEQGEPLGQLALIGQAFTSLEVLSGSRLDFEALAAWLNSPEWSRPSAGTRAHLALALRAEGLLTVTLRELLALCEHLAEPLREPGRAFAQQLTAAARHLGAARASPRLWAERFQKALADIGWAAAAAARPERQATLLHWHELLESFGELSASVAVVARAEALTVLRGLAARSTTAAPEDPTVTLTADLLDPLVRYDGIWVCGLSADLLPEPVAPNPFLPLPAQRAAGVPAASVAGRRQQASALLAAWRAATPELILSVPERAGDIELLPSPLLHGVPERTAATLVPLALRLHRAAEREPLEDEQGLPWNSRRALPGGTRSLDLQNLCPFRAYAELRLGARAPEPLEPGIAPSRRGKLLHAALQILWGELRDSQRLTDLAPAELERLISTSVTEAARQTLLGARRGRRALAATQLDLFGHVPPVIARECRRAARLIASLCEQERTRPAFTVEQAEQNVELSMGGATLHMRIDRVDRLAGGGRALLDYKSGARIQVDLAAARPSHPQLLAYAQALGEVVALAMVRVSARRVQFAGVAERAGLLPQVRALAGAGPDPESAWRAQQQAWRATLERLIADFLAGDASVDPKAGACRACPTLDLCRIGARVALTEAGDEL
jgi:ATP-dependent helicase/nuclease subunit B